MIAKSNPSCTRSTCRAQCTNRLTLPDTEQRAGDDRRHKLPDALVAIEPKLALRALRQCAGSLIRFPPRHAGPARKASNIAADPRRTFRVVRYRRTPSAFFSAWTFLADCRGRDVQVAPPR
jgi:hypothetical protein